MVRQKGKNTERIQAVLNRKHLREIDALHIRDVLSNEAPDKWTDRTLITEGLIALGEKIDKGWTAPEVPDQITISADIISMLNKMKKAVDMLSNLDISKLREIEGFDEDTFNSLNAEGLKRGAARLFSEETKFDADDW